MPRKPPEGGVRKTRYQVFFNDAECAKLEALAEAKEMTVPEYLRWRGLGVKP